MEAIEVVFWVFLALLFPLLCVVIGCQAKDLDDVEAGQPPRIQHQQRPRQPHQQFRAGVRVNVGLARPQPQVRAENSINVGLAGRPQQQFRAPGRVNVGLAGRPQPQVRAGNSINAELAAAMIRLQQLQRFDERRIEEIAVGCTECVICLGEYSSDDNGVICRTLKPCGHRFHKACIDDWLKLGRTCPVCRHVSWDSSVSVHGNLSAV